MSYNYSNNDVRVAETGSGAMVKAVVAVQLLSALYQIVAAIEGGEFNDGGSSDQYIWFGVVGAIGVLSAIWLYKGSTLSRVIALIWHLIVAGWMLTNVKTEIITAHPVLLGIVCISAVSALYLAASALMGITRAVRS